MQTEETTLVIQLLSKVCISSLSFMKTPRVVCRYCTNAINDVTSLLCVLIHISRTKLPPCMQIEKYIAATPVPSEKEPMKFHFVFSNMNLSAVLQEGIVNGLVGVHGIKAMKSLKAKDLDNKRIIMRNNFQRKDFDEQKEMDLGKYGIYPMDQSEHDVQESEEMSVIPEPVLIPDPESEEDDDLVHATGFYKSYGW